jgi:hypothetical protein
MMCASTTIANCRLKAQILLFCAVAALAGCSAQQAYYSAQGYERNQCERILDQGARAHCLAGTGASYDEYRRQTEDAARK